MLAVVNTTIRHAGIRGVVAIEMTDQQRDGFFRKVDPANDDDCWRWSGATDRHGYGKFNLKPYVAGAHRVAYQLMVGPIPDGLDLDHLCRVPPCVNPAHLEPVTRRENTMRSAIAPAAVNAAKTSCVNGHAFTEANTYRDPEGYRHCKQCRRRSQLKWIAATQPPSAVRRRPWHERLLTNPHIDQCEQVYR